MGAPSQLGRKLSVDQRSHWLVIGSGLDASLDVGIAETFVVCSNPHLSDGVESWTTQ